MRSPHDPRRDYIKVRCGPRSQAKGAGENAALIVPGDITDDGCRRRLVERALERFGAIDILINNAGLGLYAPAWSVPMEEARRLMENQFLRAFGPHATRRPTDARAPHGVHRQYRFHCR